MSGCDTNGGCANKAEILPLPKWLHDEEEIIKLLNKFLDDLDRLGFQHRKKPPVTRLTNETHPWLFRHSESNGMSWGLLRSLDAKIFLLSLKGKRDPYAAEYEGARLILLPQAEATLRIWLQRPKLITYSEKWLQAVHDHREMFDDAMLLSQHPLQLRGWEAGEIVQRLAQMNQHGKGSVTLRQLSALYFNGDSKLLDGREELISTLFPQLAISYRPLIIHAFLPTQVAALLFIENQDTYIQLLTSRPNSLAATGLVYSAGFRATATRVRSGDEVSFHYASSSGLEQRRYFESFWCGEHSQDLPLGFWGDLDYSAMAILKLLRLRFPGMTAWRPGYGELCRLLKNGFGHSPDQAEKEEQRDPGVVGCDCADEIILPMLRQHNRFVDQEAVLILK